MKKHLRGIVIGSIAGILDTIPMVLQKLTWDANLSAFTMWVVVGFLTSAVDLKLNPWIKGIVIAYLVLLPSAIIIGSKEPGSLIPITIMTLILGGLQGYFNQKISKLQK